MSALKVLFIGEASLLIRCAEHCQASGHEVVAVVSNAPHVRAWTYQNQLPLLSLDANKLDEISDLGFDYLFSVGTFELLPQTLLARARRLAINFHDGPLPRYAGLNATCWALIHGEKSHGVSWHVMTAAPDAGPIVAAAPLSIDAEETALSLNAKCYEAGFAAFKKMWAAIVAGSLTPEPQRGERTYFGRNARPEDDATLDFSKPAESLAALVRALHHGGYPNSLAMPKLLVDEAVYFPTSAKVASPLQSSPPGLILASDKSSITVATASAPIVLSDFVNSDGTPLQPAAIAALAAGRSIAALPPGRRDRLNQLIKRAAPHERAWRAALAALIGTELPYPKSRGGADHEVFEIELAPARSCDLAMAAAFAWYARIAGQGRFAVLCQSEAHQAVLGDAAPWFAAWRPFLFEAQPDQSAPTFVAAAAKARAVFEASAPMPCDLWMRMGAEARRGFDLAAPPLALSLSAAEVCSPAAILIQIDPATACVRLRVRAEAYDRVTADTIAEHIQTALQVFNAGALAPVHQIDLRSAEQRILMEQASKGPESAAPTLLLHEKFSAQALRSPERVAIRTRTRQLTYGELEQRSNLAASGLIALGAKAGMVVGVNMRREADLPIAVLAVLKSGAIYLPLDPAYPPDRLTYMAADAGAEIIIIDADKETFSAGSGAHSVRIDELTRDDGALASMVHAKASSDDTAYLMYTSGSTGRPKGVAIHHGALANFAIGMEEIVPHDPPGVWLAVTSISFDISILELLWTLTRGFSVALGGAGSASGPSFSLFFFAASTAETDAPPYRLLLDAARFADANGFEAVWTPERHFHAFGGAFPNPAITAAALATSTSRVQIRAGSCVLPLHHPIRVAEDWSVIDVLSQGRTGLAVASGWQPNDFVLDPTAHEQRKDVMLARLDQVRRLWRGESVSFADPQGKPVPIRTQPRPVQSELPVWLTAAKNPETFETAGRLGCNVLTHLLGMSLEEVRSNIEVYHRAWRTAGHQGRGRVTLMLHAFVAETDEAARTAVREPLKRYLETAMDLVREAAWTFPAMVQRAAAAAKSPAEIFDAEPLTSAERDALLDHAFERYYTQSGLMGDHKTCVQSAQRVAAAGVDEIACLIDFGVDEAAILASLPRLKRVMDEARTPAEMGSIIEQFRWSGATHAQITPSMGAMLAAERAPGETIEALTTLLIGGEALAPSLVKELRQLAPEARLFNMYGPTETTIWSTSAAIEADSDFVPLGAPICNTTLRVLSAQGDEQPALVPGELWIGGAGVGQGYWRRPDLTAERFIRDASSGEILYRTGDLVRRRPNGALEFLGRLDHQVKLRGHRVELGEIEGVLRSDPSIAEAVVKARDNPTGGARLTAYVSPARGRTIELAALREALGAKLPAVMIPNDIVVLERMPLTSNGKIDRSALPAPQDRAIITKQAPEGGLERKIAALWCEMLGLESVESTQNFFEIGGHSLLAVQVLRRMRKELAAHMTPTDLYRFPTVRTLAAHLAGGSDDRARREGLDRATARLAARRRAGAESSGSP